MYECCNCDAPVKDELTLCEDCSTLENCANCGDLCQSETSFEGQDGIYCCNDCLTHAEDTNGHLK